MKILITGGAGFLGRHLYGALESLGANVVAFDDLSIPNDPFQKYDSPPLPKNLIRGSVTHDTLPSESWDYIIHAAAPASPVAYMKAPIGTVDTIVNGTLRIAQYAAQKGAKLIHFSTSEVYGSMREVMLESRPGEVLPTAPRSCYGEAKRCADTIIATHQSYGLPAVIVRPFNIYGPGMRIDDGRVLPAFISRVLYGNGILIHGDGSHTRCFCYIDDFVEGVLRILEPKFEKHEGWKRLRVVNLGTDDEVTITEVAQIVRGVLGNLDAPIHYTGEPIADPPRRVPGIGRAKAWLRWAPPTPLREGVAKMAEDFRARIHAT